MRIMFDKKELAQLGALFEVHKRDIVKDIREETKALIAASERRLEEKILTGVAELLEQNVLPQIAELQVKVGLA